MSKGINKVILLGNLTKDPVLRYTTSGKSVCDFSIATNRSWTDEKGQIQEQAEFHHVVAWNKLAEVSGRYLAKGRKVYLEGRLQTRSYETANGEKKSRTEIVVDDLVMLDGKTQPNKTQNGQSASVAPAAGAFAHGEIPVNPEDIPF